MMRRAQPWLGTLVEITVGDASPYVDLTCFDAAFAEIALVHRLMSFHDPESDVSRINRAAIGERVAIHAHTFNVIQSALSLTVATDGIFNIHCAPRLVEWDYLPTPHPDAVMPTYIPTRSSIVLAEQNQVEKTYAGWIDLGGIAKGYAVDLAITTLQRLGVVSACVNAGGDLRVCGDIPYPIAIRHPVDPVSMAQQMIICNEALATSGTYFSSKRIHDQEYSALLNGKDGMVVTANFSASVCAPTCMLADALTKVVMATGDSMHPALAQFGARALIIA